jgi:hypothetical protein
MARSRPTLEHYEQVLHLRRARVPVSVIPEIVGLPGETVAELIAVGLRARKGKHPAKRPIKSVLVEDQAEAMTQAQEWAGSIGTAAREAARERSETALAASRIEGLLVKAWSSKCSREIAEAKKHVNEDGSRGRPVDLAELMPGSDLLSALRTLRWTRDLASDARAPFELYRGRLEAVPADEGRSGPELDASVFADLMGLDEDALDAFARGEEMPKQLALPAVES